MLKLALKDLLFDRLISACQIAAIAAILAPLLLLFSLRYGVLTELQNKLLQDPKVLALTLDTSYRLDEKFFIDLRQEPEVGFVMPEVAALNALVDIRFKNGVERVSIMATAPGDPVILNSGIDFKMLHPVSVPAQRDPIAQEIEESKANVPALAEQQSKSQDKSERLAQQAPQAGQAEQLAASGRAQATASKTLASGHNDVESVIESEVDSKVKAQVQAGDAVVSESEGAGGSAAENQAGVFAKSQANAQVKQMGDQFAGQAESDVVQAESQARVLVAQGTQVEAKAPITDAKTSETNNAEAMTSASEVAVAKVEESKAETMEPESEKADTDAVLGLRDDEAFISEDLALERGVKVGDKILVVVSRTLNGKHQVARVNFTVRGIVKQRFLNDDFVGTNLKVVTYLDDYRTGYEPPIFSDGSYVKTTPRYYAKFRLFAKDIDAVIPLYYKLVEKHLNVSSKVGEIENIQAIARVLNFIFIVIAAVSGVGGALALGGLMLSSLKSRKRNFILLRLMGQSNAELYGLVVLENFILASNGFVLALMFYLLGSSLFNQYFGALLPEAVVSQLKLWHGLLFYGITLGVAGFLALISAKYIFLKAQIADVLREA